MAALIVMRQDNNPKELCNYIIAVLKKYGIIIQRYDSMTTSSIYLKLDYGLCNSIRISDHYGKKQYDYRFNIYKNLKHSYATFEEYERFYYTFAEVDKMIEDILRHKENRISSYSLERYLQFMESNKIVNKNAKGFWSKAKVV